MINEICIHELYTSHTHISHLSTTNYLPVGNGRCHWFISGHLCTNVIKLQVTE